MLLVSCEATVKDLHLPSWMPFLLVYSYLNSCLTSYWPETNIFISHICFIAVFCSGSLVTCSGLGSSFKAVLFGGEEVIFSEQHYCYCYFTIIILTYLDCHLRYYRSLIEVYNCLL